MNSCRLSVVRLFAAILSVMVPFAAAAASPARFIGPITGGAHGRPFMTALMDLQSSGFVEEEFFVSGEAQTYHPSAGSKLTPDGNWHIATRPGGSFRTRILVRRPADPRRFNGMVIVEWFQPSAGFDKDVNWLWLQREILREGYAWVGVSAQKESVDGARPFPGIGLPDLTHWDPTRYGTLTIPSDDLSYDIFAQVGRGLKGNRAKGSADPMGELSPKWVVAVGNTFASDRLFPFYNAVQPGTRAYDGFVIGWRHSTGGQPLATDATLPEIVQLRSDIATPVIVLNSLAEAPRYRPALQPDGPSFRLWEIAGSAHTNAYWAPQMYAIMKREFGLPVPVCPRPFNDLPTQYVFSAAIARMHDWLALGRAPVSLPPLELTGRPAKVATDALGNALGGLRLPEIEVPVARFEAGGDPNCPGGPGYVTRLSDQQILELYPRRDIYLARFDAAARRAVAQGILQPADATDAEAAARRFAGPWPAVAR